MPQAYANPAPQDKQAWLDVFGTTKLPLVSPRVSLAKFPNEAAYDQVYFVDTELLTKGQQDRAIWAFAERFNLSEMDAKQLILEEGLPISAKDVAVTFDDPVGLVWKEVS